MELWKDEEFRSRGDEPTDVFGVEEGELWEGEDGGRVEGDEVEIWKV